jgi:hypothetical protein
MRIPNLGVRTGIFSSFFSYLFSSTLICIQIRGFLKKLGCKAGFIRSSYENLVVPV